MIYDDDYINEIYNYLLFADNLTLIEKDIIVIRDHNHDLTINCSTSTPTQQSSNIAWARVLYDPIFEITEEFTNYTMNGLDLIFHNATRDTMGIYACYANDTNTVYKVIKIAAVECKYM